ncbi:MAG: RsmB/NOP family class I SAM-dependent RNA methyltransferase [Pseudomonadota bacterium]
MTPAARVQAAIEIIDDILAHMPAEKALKRWARGARYAGSKDRAAVRDFVYQALRCRDSYARMGHGMTGRGIMIGQIRALGHDTSALFTGAPYAPRPLSEAEHASNHERLSDAGSDQIPNDLPPWLMQEFAESLGAQNAIEAAAMLRQRAPVAIRLNARKTTRAALIASLLDDGIVAEPVAGVTSALHLTDAARRFSQSNAYKSGAAELQDAHSQAAMARLESYEKQAVLDYCAGGGGKTLALAAQGDARFFAYDADPRRMSDLPERARRAGVRVDILSAETLEQHGPYDLVLCDVPCSGSGTWRRQPDAKWTLTRERFEALCQMQSDILKLGADLTRAGGYLAYTTCSVLRQENTDQIDAFLSSKPDWKLAQSEVWPINATGDGFFLAVLRCPGGNRQEDQFA